MKQSMLVLAVSTLCTVATATGTAGAALQRRGQLQTRFLGLPAKSNVTVQASSTAKVGDAKSSSTARVASDAKSTQNATNASDKVASTNASAPAKPIAKSPLKTRNATAPQSVPQLLASPSMGLLVGEVDKFLDFFVKPDSLELDAKKFKEMYPMKHDFMPACLAHVHRLVNKVDLSYTDVQLVHVLEHECGYMQDFKYVVVNQFGSKKDCKKFAEVLVAARDEELSSGKVTGYTKFCSSYYDFQSNKTAPVVVMESGTALLRIPLLLMGLAMMNLLHLF